MLSNTMFFELRVNPACITHRTATTVSVDTSITDNEYDEEVWYPCPFCGRDSYRAFVVEKEGVVGDVPIVRTCCGMAALDVEVSGEVWSWRIASERNGHIGVPFKRVKRVCTALKSVGLPGTDMDVLPALVFDWAEARTREDHSTTLHPYLVDCDITVAVEYDGGHMVFITPELCKTPHPSLPSPGLLVLDDGDGDGVFLKKRGGRRTPPRVFSGLPASGRVYG
jgi:hypothetical protein